MKPVAEHISQIQAKLQQLLRNYDQLKKENSRLSSKLEELQNQSVERENELIRLQQQNLLLKASVSKMDEKDKKKLESQINMYLKNIDTCIAMLSQ